MTKTLTASIAAMTLATATAAVPTAADARCPGCVGEPPPSAPPGYVYYSSYHEPLPAPCNWYRIPVYDGFGNMISWRGRRRRSAPGSAGSAPTPEGVRRIRQSVHKITDGRDWPSQVNCA